VLAIVYKKCYTEKSFGCQEIWGKSYFEIGALEILCILAAILKMDAKMTAILKSHWSQSHSSKNP
jgi:hypothetical protein